MSRKEDLLKVFDGIDAGEKEIVINLIDEVIFLEDNLTELKKQPFIKVHPTNKNLSKQTAAGKMYKEMLQQYNNTIKLLISVLRKDESDGESPLAEFNKKLDAFILDKTKKGL